jgi:hypothetical protein
MLVHKFACAKEKKKVSEGTSDTGNRDGTFFRASGGGDGQQSARLQLHHHRRNH